ncbi:MAG: hypothetical protein ACK5Q5_24095 [Planctomycetaceae bacterium]
MTGCSESWQRPLKEEEDAHGEATTPPARAPEPPQKLRPGATVRQGNLKIVLWRNMSEKGPWYTADLVRTFRDESGYHDTNKVPADDLLRVSHLAEWAFTELLQFKAQNRQEQQDEPFEPQS